MFAILHALGMFVADLFKSRSRLEAENLFLRHQLNIALRSAQRGPRLRASDRVLMTRLWPRLLGAVQIVQPETILRWHRAGFKMFWRWKSRGMAGRPRIDRGLGHQHRPICCATTIVPMGTHLRLGSEPWGFATDRSQLDRRGRMALRNV